MKQDVFQKRKDYQARMEKKPQHGTSFFVVISLL